MALFRGIGIVLFIVVLAGVIAYIGDRVGHQVGRKRLTLFNIRPRYTSTIIAVATGMIIAFVVTLAAIFASNQVKVAFFQLSEINATIARLRARETALEQKVNNSPVLVNLGELMSSSVARIPMNAPGGLRNDIVRSFYQQAVASVNRTYTRPPYNLKKFVPPANLDTRLASLADSPQIQAWVAQSDVLLIVNADQNLYPHDEIHFGITPIQDKLLVTSGQPIASINIPGGKNADANVALAELLGTYGYVPRQMSLDGMPPYFAGNVLPQRMLPDADHMRAMLSSGGTYIMTAFAAGDIYPHTFGVPVVVTLQKAPAQ